MENFSSITCLKRFDIQTQIDLSKKQTIEKNRAILRPIVDTILTCARQNIALRGHRNEIGSIDADGIDPDENYGNFRALLRFRIRGGDLILQDHARTTKANATYQSADIQNNLLSIAGEIVKEKVTQKIKKSMFWSINADETTDRHKREQLAVVIRYVIPNSEGIWQCHEDTIAILDVFADVKANSNDNEIEAAPLSEVRLTGLAIGETSLRIVKLLDLNLSACVGQG